jgi:hypothetical protein
MARERPVESRSKFPRVAPPKTIGEERRGRERHFDVVVSDDGYSRAPE